MTDLLIAKLNVVLRNTGNLWRPGDLGVLRGVAEGVAKEARTRGFASQTFVRFAFVDRRILSQHPTSRRGKPE
jgi:hypothetical protein